MKQCCEHSQWGEGWSEVVIVLDVIMEVDELFVLTMETAKWLCGVWWFDFVGVVLLADECCVDFGSDSFLERRDAGIVALVGMKLVPLLNREMASGSSDFVVKWVFDFFWFD